MEKDYLTQLSEEMAAENPEYAKLKRRADMVRELLKLRHRLKQTQQQVAAKMGVNRPQVAAIEADPLTASLDMIANYAAALGAEIVVKLPDVAA